MDPIDTFVPYPNVFFSDGGPGAGFFVFGYMFSFVLFGILVMQCFVYHTRFQNDSWWLKLFVWCVAFLECLSLAFTVYEFWLGTSLECLACVVTMNEVTWPMGVLIILAGLIASLVHAFYCWRIWIIAQSFIMPCVVMLVSLTQCVFAILEGLSFMWINSEQFISSLFDIPVITRTWVVLSCLCDIVITIHTIRLLLRKKSGTKFKRTQFLVVKLVKLTIETGMITVVATFLTTMYLFFTTWAYYSMFTFLSTLYANCLLATLNARIFIRNSSQHYQLSTALFDGNDGELEGVNGNNVNATLWPRHNSEISLCHRQNVLSLERVPSLGACIPGPPQVGDECSEDSIPTIISLPPIHRDARQWEMTSMPWVDRS